MLAGSIVELRPLILVVDLWVLAMVGLVHPLVRDYGDDQGDGDTLVLLPPPKLPRFARTFSFLGLFIAFVVAYESLKGRYRPDALYASLLERVSNRVVAAPAEIHGYLAGFTLGLRVLVVGTIVTLALACRATPMRRVCMVLQACWYVGAIFLFDVLLIVVAAVTHMGVAPGTMFGNAFAFFVGFLALARLLYASFALPNPTGVPFRARRRFDDAVVLVGSTVIGMCCGFLLVYVVYRAADPRYRPFLGLVSPIPFAFTATLVRDILLAVTGMFFLRQSRIGSARPPIDIIIPAYNEELVIVATLEAIDVAAERYGGPVHVILTDDGSTDRTRELVDNTFAAFTAATGEVVDGHHGGKSAALNLALARAQADLMVRIDADTVIHENALLYLPRWFRDPSIGLVEALEHPGKGDTVFHRVRLFEELKTFGLNHRLYQNVDAVCVVPGLFCAFRRAPAVALGGFTVGMNGEDGDFTMRMIRLGWRIRFDPKIIVYEDIPSTFMEIREQRVRWSRATIHNQARHGTYRAGMSTPSMWFSQTHNYFARVSSPIHFMLPAYLVVYAIFQGAWRGAVIAFIGALIVGQIVRMIVSAFLATGYGFGRRVPWVLLFPIWQLCLVMFSAESILSLPGRPVTLFGRRELITEAVVH